MVIDIAYSKEKQKLMTAIEANELWQNRELSDKHAFTCPGKDCDAPITCTNMDKFEIDQKRVPHFIWGHRTVEHSENCDYETIINQWREAQHINASQAYNDERDQNEVIFDCNNIEHRNTTVHTTVKFNQKDKSNNEVNKIATNNLNSNVRPVKPHYNLLSSLVNLFLDAEKENDLENNYVRLSLDNKTYTYKLSTLFAKVSDYEFNNSKIKVFYGNAGISNYNGKYYINFEDKFKNDDAKVRCTIKQKDILKVKNAKIKLKNFDNYLNKDDPVQVFVLGKSYKFRSKENNETIIYINPFKGSFDLVAVKNRT